MIYSPQMLNTFKECPIEYYLKFVQGVQPPVLESSFLVGKNIHAIASYYLKGQDISMFSLSEKEQRMWDTLLKSPYFNLKAERVESTVACPVDGVWIGGRLDALVRNENNEYFILDYKTGEIPANAHNNFQTIVYLLCCDKLIPDYSALNFTYISVKTGEVETISFSDKLRQKYETDVKLILSEIKKLSEPTVKRTAKCSRCAYSKVCV